MVPVRDLGALPWAWSAHVRDDPRPWLLASDEPAARWVVLTGVLDRPHDDPAVVDARAAVLADAAVHDLLERIPDWERGMPLSGHASPAFAPNLLNLLGDMGVRRGDDRRLDAILRQMLAHQDDEGRFQTYAPPRQGERPVWGTLLCDNHAILEALVRFGFADDPRVLVGLGRMVADLTTTAQGRAWPCRPDPVTGFRGPGRRGDACPQVTLEALRVLSYLPPAARPADPLGPARACLRVWRDRGTQKPYMFGHGRSFKTAKWPVTWYGALAMLDTLGRYPSLWSGPDALPEDRASLAELAACLIAYNLADDGRATPRSVFRGFEVHSFGQKRRPSAFATASVLAVLHRLDDLAGDALAVDVTALASSKGGTGQAVPPRT